MNCPYCGGQRVKGFVQSRSDLVWDAEERPIAALPSFRKDSIYLAVKDWSCAGATAVAYNCQGCKKIILDYSVRNL